MNSDAPNRTDGIAEAMRAQILSGQHGPSDRNYDRTSVQLES